MPGAATRDSLRRLANRVRAIPGRDFGLRPYTVELITALSAGDYGLEGAVSTTTTTITVDGGQPPKVRQLNDEQIALGNLDAGDVEVGPITPDHAGGGHSWATLTGSALADGYRLYYRLTGPDHPDGALYRLVRGYHDRALRYRLILRPVAAS